MKLMLVDGNNLTWRAFGRAPLVYNGQRTEVIKIGLMMLRSYLDLFRPDRVYVIWDGGHNKKRVELYPEYKKKKETLTEIEKRERDLFFQQLDQLHETIKLMGIDQIRCRGQEADDVIFTLVKHWSVRYPADEILVISTDQDMFQLFLYSSKVQVYAPNKEKRYHSALEVEQELGIPLKYYISYKAIVGDSSDNLPGIKGIGPVGAKALIEWFQDKGSIEDKLLEKFDELTFRKMRCLISFIDVPSEEIQVGWDKASRILENMYLAAVQICEQYGFEQWQESMASFTDPFDKYLRARVKEPCEL